jgi:hypothetical protein
MEKYIVAVAVDIADRLYDYTDEEKAAEAVAEFQIANELSDHEIITIWSNAGHPLRQVLEKLIFDAVDANGTVKRASESVPGDITLSLAS